MHSNVRHEATRKASTTGVGHYWRWIRYAIIYAILALHMVLLSAQHLSIAPTWLSELTRFVPYYWILVPALLALVLSIGLRPVHIAVCLANILLLMTVTMGLQWNRSDANDVNDVQGVRIRVLTYNAKAFKAVHREGGLAAISTEIRRLQPDIVALQDADGWVVARSESTPTPSPPMFGLPHVVALGQYLVASRFPLSSCVSGHIDFRSESHRYLRCEVNVNGNPIQLVTAHFVSPRHALTGIRQQLTAGLAAWAINLNDRQIQSRRLLVDLISMPRPLIVMGDFNAQEGSSVVELLKQAGLRDAFSVAGRGYGYTHGHSLAKGLDTLRIDHVLVSAEIGVVNSEVGAGDASEHNPVVADLLVQR